MGDSSCLMVDVKLGFGLIDFSTTGEAATSRAENEFSRTFTVFVVSTNDSFSDLASFLALFLFFLEDFEGGCDDASGFDGGDGAVAKGVVGVKAEKLSALARDDSFADSIFKVARSSLLSKTSLGADVVACNETSGC